jgi:hypothetical protein
MLHPSLANESLSNSKFIPSEWLELTEKEKVTKITTPNSLDQFGWFSIMY